MCAGTALQYYFTVNTRYVRNKLKVLLFPFTLRGHWNRTLEQARIVLAAHRPAAGMLTLPASHLRWPVA